MDQPIDLDSDEQLSNDTSDGSAIVREPDTVDLTMDDDDDVENIDDDVVSDHESDDENPVEIVNAFMNLVQNGNHAANGEIEILDDVELIVEDANQKTEEEMIEENKTISNHLLSWFKRLKPEHFKEFGIGGNDYLTEYVNDEPLFPLEKCKDAVKQFKESGSLTGLVEKCEFENEDSLIAGICMGVLDDNNSLGVDFSVLAEDRFDNWSIKQLELYFNKVASEGLDASPLKFMQLTLSSPANAILLLTYYFMLINKFTSPIEEPESSENFLEELDGREIYQRIVDASAHHWQQNKSSVKRDAQINRDLNEFFHEIEATTVEMREQFENTVGQRSEIISLIREKVPRLETPSELNLQIMTKEARDELVRSRAAMELLKNQTMNAVGEARKVYQRKTSLEKHHALKPGDFCMARMLNTDTADLKHAIVEQILSAEKYRVKFLHNNETADRHVRDLALTNHGLCSPLYNGFGDVGLRVAVCCPLNTGQYSKTWIWKTGTTASRRSGHRGDFLVFLDDGSDVYVTAPCKAGDPGYSTVVAKKEGAPLTFQDVLTRMKAARIAVMVGQPFGESGRIERQLVHRWVRERHRSHFIKTYMKDFPEFQVLKMPIGFRTTMTKLPPDNKEKHLITVVGLDRVFAIVRYQAPSGVPGYNCFEYPCKNSTHYHMDEHVYRGSSRITQVSSMREMMTQVNNNLSKRKKDQLASQFELSESVKTMPQRTTNHALQTSVPSIRTNANKESQAKQKALTVAEIEKKKKNQLLFHKTVVPTPNISKEKIAPHAQCGPDCLQKMDANPYDARFHTNSPLHTPLLCGWKRLKYTMHSGKKRATVKKVIIYRAPCGKPLDKTSEIADYLSSTRSQLTIDCFSFSSDVDTETYITVDQKYVRMSDISLGLEGIPIPLVNSVDSDPNPVLEYCKRRFPYNASVDVSSISQDFCSGCSCDGDCSNSSTCECQKLSAEASDKLPKHLKFEENKRLASTYSQRVLTNKVITGIYECNDKCSCKRDACHNRVVQNNIKYPVHIFKTAQSGWGLRALTDIPIGAFVCTYVGALLTNDLAEDQHGSDQYFADLDLKDGVEMAKGDEDHETDLGLGDEVSDGDFTDEDDNDSDDDDNNDSTVQHRGIKIGNRKHETRRNSQEDKLQHTEINGENGKKEEETEKKEEPVFNWDDYFDKFALYVVDAKHRGNLGRFLNHSCAPNCVVQHVLYDTHDLRLPWVAFFTIKHIKAGDELTWDYQYTELNSETSRLSCNCGSEVCRHRLL
ncbi:hypothetical protein B9Z55_009957 [Caenorhabditis nigoni]|uniref:Histone-lysine N-methyltransferase n=1 Tax=Caenorhabditis nigoni TaxID=1611254 RepID=A0A2G5UU97_9PELO|nr:hypothetical protein B9Z55_009957 [Caenorhabditis nigoni]